MDRFMVKNVKLDDCNESSVAGTSSGSITHSTVSGSSKTVVYQYNWTASVVQWSEFLATDPEVQVRFPALRDFLSSGSGTGSTQPREDN
jgi:hypothetical protein